MLLAWSSGVLDATKFGSVDDNAGRVEYDGHVGTIPGGAGLYGGQMSEPIGGVVSVVGAAFESCTSTDTGLLCPPGGVISFTLTVNLLFGALQSQSVTWALDPLGPAGMNDPYCFGGVMVDATGLSSWKLLNCCSFISSCSLFFTGQPTRFEHGKSAEMRLSARVMASFGVKTMLPP